MAKTVGVDKWLYFATLGLVVIGLAMVFSASAVMARENFGSPYFFLERQAVYAGGGLVCMTLLMQVNYGRYNRPSVVFPMVGHHDHAAAGRVFHARLAQHASLDSLRAAVVPAIGVCEAGAGAVSGVVSAEPHGRD